MCEVKEHSARNAAGRAMIERVLAYATRVIRTDIDLVIDERSSRPMQPEDLRRHLDADGRSATLYEIDATTFVYLNAYVGAWQSVTRCTITTVAMCE